jgi:hypothetical protein
MSGKKIESSLEHHEMAIDYLIGRWPLSPDQVDDPKEAIAIAQVHATLAAAAALRGIEAQISMLRES